MSVDNETLRKLIDAGRILETNGLGDLTRGHISIRIPGQSDRFVMKPHSYGFDEITPENAVICDFTPLVRLTAV